MTQHVTHLRKADEGNALQRRKQLWQMTALTALLLLVGGVSWGSPTIGSSDFETHPSAPNKATNDTDNINGVSGNRRTGQVAVTMAMDPVLNSSTMTGYPSLQAAIDAASANDVLVLQADITEGLVTVNKDITIDGDGKKLTSTSASWGVVVETTGVTIEDLTIDDAGTFGLITGCGSDNLTVTNVTVQNGGGTGFAITGSDNLTLTNISSLNNGGNGISITNCNNVTINGLTTSGNAFSGGFSAGVGIFTSASVCPPAGTSSIGFTGTISIGEPVDFYQQGAAGTITGVTLPMTYTYFAGSGATDRYYTVDLAGSYGLAAALIDAGVPATSVHVEDLATGTKFVNDDITNPTAPPATIAMSIQAAINNAASGETVRIESGSYTGNVDATTNTVTLAPGNSPGCVTIAGNMTLNAGDVLDIEANSATACTGYDQFTVNGTVTLGGATLNLILGYVPILGHSYTIISNDLADAVVGQFTQGGYITVGAHVFSINYAGGDGNDVVLTKCGGVTNTNTSITYCTIQEAINDPLTLDGHTLTVAAGTYTESIVITKALTINGPNVGVAGTGIRVAEAILLNCSIDINHVGNTTLDGLQIKRTDGSTGPTNQIELDGGGTNTVQNCIFERNGANTGQEIRAIATTTAGGNKAILNNKITGDASGGLFSGHKSWARGIYVDGGVFTVNIAGNTIENCRTGLNLDDFSTSVTVAGNTINNNGTHLSFGGSIPTTGSFTLGANNFINNPSSTMVNLSNVAETFRLDITSSTLNGAPFTSLTTAQLFEVEARMFHKERTSTRKGKVIYKSNNQYVNNFTSPVTKIDKIQNSIKYADAGDIINLEDGTYPEKLTVDKSNLTLQGVSNDKTLYVIDGTGLGVASGILLNGGMTNITIQDLTVQNFTGGGGNANAGIYGVASNDNLVIDNVALLNNTSASGFYANGPVNNVSVTNSMAVNNGSGARGMVIWNGLKTNITFTGNMVTNNVCCGIELSDGNASGVNISNNTIDVGSGDNAIGVVGLNTSTGANTINNNTITGGGRFGIEIKNPAGGVTVSANSVTLSTQNSDVRDRAGIAILRRGVLSGNVDVPNGVTITGNTVTGYQQSSTSEGFGIVVEGTNHTVTGNIVNTCDVGILQQQNPSNYPGDANQADVVDLYFGRGNAPQTCGNTISGNTFSGNGLNERNIGVGGGFVVNDDTDEVFCSIQAAINDAQTLNGHTLLVPAGTYAENVTVSKSLTIKGANADVNCSGRASESIVSPASGIAFNVTASQVTINGFEVTSPAGANAIVLSGDASALTANFNKIHNVGTLLTTGVVHAVMYQLGSGAQSNVSITDNCIYDIASSALSNSSASAVGILQSVSTGTLSGLVISDNIINNVTVNNAAWPVGKIAYGIVMNVGGNANYMTNTGNVVNASINNNEITNLSGHIATAIGLEGNTQGAQVINNLISNLSGTKSSTRAGGGLDISGVKLENNKYASSVNVQNNGFMTNTFANNGTPNLGYAVSNYVPTANGGTLALGCNWYGTAVANLIEDNATLTGKLFNKDNCTTTFTPYITSGADGGGIGFQPSGACTGTPVVIASAVPDHIICGETTGSIEVAFSGGTGAYNIAWTGGSATGISSPYTIPSLAAGAYMITVTDVNGSFATTTASVQSLPVTNVTDMPNTYYPTIQAAINAATTSPGEEIQVCAGTYAENIVVNKELTINGPNAGIDACSGTRVAEAILTTAVSDIAGTSAYSIVDIQASNVTITGFTIDGDNPNITTGKTSTNGADIDIALGVTRYVTGTNATISNNIVQNLSYFGIELYDYPAAVPSAGNIVSNNKIQDLGTYDPTSGIAFWGGGVLLYNNQYAEVENNCMTNVRIGVQTGNFHLSNPGGAEYQSIANNTIQSRRVGIFHNLHYSAASPITLSGNTLTTLDNSNDGGWRGILLGSLSVASTVTNNTVNGTGSTRPVIEGINVWNCQTAPAISGGAISNVQLGINVNNFEGYASNANNTVAVVDGVSITGATIAGVKVHDNPLNTNSATVSAEIKGNTSISGSPIGIWVLNSGASANIHDNPASINGNPIGIDVDGGTANITNNHIYDNGIGVRFTNAGTGTLATNKFQGATNNGKDIQATATAGTVTATPNNWFAGTTYGIENQGTTNINAIDNYWNATSGPGAVGPGTGALVTTFVNYCPWLNGIPVAFGGSGTSTTPVPVIISPAETSGVANNDGIICNGASVTLNTGAITGTPTYLWAPGGATTSSITVSPTNTTTYTVTVTQGGCTVPDEQEIIVNPLPNTTITTAAAVCSGSEGNTASIPDAGMGSAYVWNLTNGTVTSGQGSNSITYTAGASGTVTVSVNVSNAVNCFVTNSTNVTINPLPTVAPITGTLGVPVGATTQLASATSGGVWASSNIGVATINLTGEVTGVSTGTSTITYTVTDINGCTSSQSAIVTVGNPIFDIGIFNEPVNSDLYAVKIRPLANATGDYSAGKFTVLVPTAAGVSLSVNSSIYGYTLASSGTVGADNYYIFAFDGSNTINWAAATENVVAILKQSGSCNGVGNFTIVTPFSDMSIVGDYYQELGGAGVQNVIYQATATGPLDVVPPVITTGTINACYNSISAAESAAITATSATDNCTSNANITFTASTSGTCNAVITVFAEDESGNIAQTTYNTKILSIAPVVTNDGSTVSCVAAAVPPALPIVTDQCGTVVTPGAVVEGGTYTTCEGTKTYSYPYTDCAGNVSTWVYTYIISAPVWNAPLAAGSTVACPADAVAPGAADIMDNCGRTISGVLTAQSTTPTCNGTKSYTYTYTACDNTTQDWVYTYTIDHTTPPAVPTDGAATVECPADATPPTPPTVSDVCGVNVLAVLVSTVDVINPLTGEGTRTYNYTYTDCSGLVSNWKFVYTIDDTQPPTITAPTNITTTVNTNSCSAIVPLLGTPATGDNCSVATVTWAATGATPATGTAATTNNIVFPLGSTTVVWTVTDAAGNMTMTNQTVVVSTTLAASATNLSTTAICTGQSTNLSFTITGGSSPYTITYSQTPGANTTVAGYTDGQLLSVSPTTGNTPTVYTYALVSVTDAYGCVIMPGVSNMLTVNPLPAVTANATGVMCGGNPVGFDLQAYLNSGFGNGVASDFSWYVLTDNPSVGGEVFTPTTGDIITTVLTNVTQFPQSVVYRVTPTSLAGCVGAFFDVTITVYPVPNIAASNASICSGTNTAITVTNPNGVFGANFSWTATYGAITGGVGAATGVAFGTNAINETLVNTTPAPIDVVYTLTPIGTGPTFCPGMPLNITVSVTPTVGTVTITGPLVVCQDDANAMYVTNPTNNTGVTYSVSPVAAGVINAATGEMNWDAAYSGPVTITAVATGCNGSSQTGTLAVTVNPEPVITITQPIPVCVSLNLESVAITTTILGGTYTYHATLADATSGTNPLTGLAVTAASVDAYVRYTLPTGCFTTGLIDVTTGACVQITAKALLQGPFNIGNNLMFDNLRTGNHIPTSDPYAVGTFKTTPSLTANYSTYFTAVNGGGTKTINAGVLAVTGSNAIVDWVFIELRDTSNRDIVVATRAALIQRDGDIVDMNGTSPVLFASTNRGAYFVAIRHRNHLGIMTDNPVGTALLSPPALDFTDPLFEVYNPDFDPMSPILTNARKSLATGIMGLWAGNASLTNLVPVGRQVITYNGSNNDRNTILTVLGGNQALTLPGYQIQDINMNGVVVYNGSNNDRVVILNNLLGNQAATIKEQLKP